MATTLLLFVNKDRHNQRPNHHTRTEQKPEVTLVSRVTVENNTKCAAAGQLFFYFGHIDKAELFPVNRNETWFNFVRCIMFIISVRYFFLLRLIVNCLCSYFYLFVRSFIVVVILRPPPRRNAGTIFPAQFSTQCWSWIGRSLGLQRHRNRGGT